MTSAFRTFHGGPPSLAVRPDPVSQFQLGLRRCWRDHAVRWIDDARTIPRGPISLRVGRALHRRREHLDLPVTDTNDDRSASGSKERTLDDRDDGVLTFDTPARPQYGSLRSRLGCLHF